MTTREKAYRRWLFCYPRAYRRSRGDEIIGTMLDAAPADRTHPTWGDRGDLVRCGLRARLGRPAGRLVVVFAVMLALIGAVLGGEAAAWASWQAAPALPGNGALVSMARDALATSSLGQPQAGSRVDRTIGYNEELGYSFLGGAEEYDWGRADIWAYNDNHPDYAAQSRIVHEQLRKHRWEVSEIRTEFDRSSFSARKDGLLLEVAIDQTARPGQTTFGFRLAGQWTLPVTLLGVLVGALLGWCLAGWLSRRTEDRAAALQALVLLLAGVATVLQLPAVLLASTGPFGLWTWWRTFDTYEPGVPPGFSYVVTRPITLLSLVFVLITVGLAALPRRNPGHPARPRDGSHWGT